MNKKIELNLLIKITDLVHWVFDLWLKKWPFDGQRTKVCIHATIFLVGLSAFMYSLYKKDYLSMVILTVSLISLVNWWFTNDLVRLARERRSDQSDPKTKISYCEETGLCALDIDKWARLQISDLDKICEDKNA